MSHTHISPQRGGSEESWLSMLIVIALMIAVVFISGYVVSEQITKFVGSLQFADSDTRSESAER